MAVLLSPVGGVAAQFFDNNGKPLSGGKLFTYTAGSTTPAATFTSSLGITAHTNPIVLDAAGRVPGGEIWLTDGIIYKFVLQTSTNVQIATYDNIVGINSNFVNFTLSQEIQTATAGQTVFTLNTMQYQPGTNSLSVFVDGVNQYGPGAQFAYVETDATTVTFVSGLHVGASVKFTTSTQTTGNATDASVVGYTPPFIDSVVTTVEDKLAQTLSIQDFGGVADGVTDNSQAFIDACAAAIDSGLTLVFPTGQYMFDTTAVVTLANGESLSIDGQNSTLLLNDPASFEQIQIKNSNPSNGATVNISNLHLKGLNAVAGPYWNQPAGSYPTNIALLVDATNININNFSVEDLWGKALNIGYFTNVSINNVTFRKVGGHSETYIPDSFGDAIYFNRISGSAVVNITNFDAEGLLNPSPGVTAGGGLSRAGIVFELNAADANTLEVNVTNFQCANFERTFHFEDVCNSSLNINGAKVQNTALMTHLYQPGPTFPTLTVLMDNVYYDANPAIAFQTNLFFFNACGGTVRNSTFINPTKAWNGNVTTVPGGFNMTFEDSDFFWNDARLQGENCAVTFNDCRMYDYNDDQSNATLTVAYQKCLFSTTQPATFGNVLSTNAGAETFFSCDFTNQRPAVVKTVQNNRYRTDDGIASGSCIRVNNATTDIPRIPNSVYKVMEVNTGITRLGYVDSAGAIYAPGAIPAIQAGSTATTVRAGATVTFSAFVEISQHE
jgi:hypothetical protein